ncbi:hypothetical protein NCS52_00683900 [Fusarium sp. LHS14.1]|nr:hypothetical protein NCS52_00683900 [Fusarium sp. LHS14.1]
MEDTAESRTKDDFKELAEKPTGGGIGWGDVPAEQESGTATTGTTAAATETAKSGKDDGMPGINSGQNGGGGGDDYVPVFYTSQDTAAIKYSINDDIVLKNIYWQTTGSGGAYIANATYKSGDDNPDLTAGFQEVTDNQLTLLLDESLLKAYLGQTMEILVDWESEDKKFTGNTRSLYFSVSSQTNTTLEEEIQASASHEVSLETTTAATATSSASATDSASSSGGGGGGLSTGAKAGIAVGAVIGGLLIIGALAFFLLRRRRRSKQLGEDYTSQQAYTVDKETHGRATDSPNSPYSDENQVQPVALQNISHDHEEQAARGTPTPNNLPRTSTGSRGATPQGMSSNVAHLVEDGMTAEEIRRLEEEERQLDDEIERAARR